MSAIDPGVEETLKEQDDDRVSQNKEDEDLVGQSTEWWFASTASPLLAATFGPMANGFSICALVYSWRSYIPPNSTPANGFRLPDPRWLIAINAVSLVFALIGNFTLLLNMAKRLRFSIAQPMTIAGFYVAGILLIADMAALGSSNTYWITEPKAIPSANHALTGAFYYAVWAAAIYIIVASLMCLTVYGANTGHYKRDFQLTPAQRTLMLQTMSYMGYWLIGALVYSKIEGWKYLDAVYWAQVTLLTIGLGDYSPQTPLGQGLLFPYAIGGILTVGLVVGSIRSLVLERGKQKISARITEKRREQAVRNVDSRRQTIKIGMFARAEFSTDPKLTPAQRREEEFNVMRKVQRAAEREKRYFGLLTSLFFALVLWFVGAAIFMVCERESKWTYLQSLYFTFTSLLTIGYGDFTPSSNAGKSFFVFWSMLAVPSLTILISNMGDTIVKWVSDVTDWVAKFTVLPERKKTTKKFLSRLSDRTSGLAFKFSPPGLLGIAGTRIMPEQLDGREHQRQILEQLATRLEKHIEQEELEAARKAGAEGDFLEQDIRFYHYVLSRESRNVQKFVGASPPKQFEWHDWEYYLKLMGNVNEDDPNDDADGHKDPLVPEALRMDHPMVGALENESGNDDPASSSSSTAIDADKDGVVDRATERKNKYAWHPTTRSNRPQPGHTHSFRRRPTQEDPLSDWSWLSEESPLMSPLSEAEWIFDRLSAALVRELDRERKGYRRQPPVSVRHVLKAEDLQVRHFDADLKGDAEEGKSGEEKVGLVEQ